MEVIKRRILLEDFISRDELNYGAFTAQTININVFITQKFDDLGVSITSDYIDEDWLTPATLDGIPNLDNYLVERATLSGLTYPFEKWDNPDPLILSGDTYSLRPSGSTISDFSKDAGYVTGFTDSKESSVRSYSATEPYPIGLDMKVETYDDYRGDTIIGLTRITSFSPPEMNYVIDANDDANIGTLNQNTGILYNDNTGITRTVVHTDTNTIYEIPQTTARYFGQGFHELNVGLFANFRKDYHFGISDVRETESDIFIERGEQDIAGRHLRLSEIKTIDDLMNYNNGYYNIEKQ